MDIDENDLPEWIPLWDPMEFTDEHPKPKPVDFQYSEETLKQLAIRATTIRADIRKKVELHSPVDEVHSLDRWNKRTRKGQKHSTKADNPEGLKEKDIKAREVLQIFPVRKFKKRTSSQLSYNEVTDIFDTYLHK